MHAPSSRLPHALRDHYYSARYWASEDLWTSFHRIADGQPQAVAFIEGDRFITFADLRIQAERFGRAAAARGLKAGDVLIIHGRQCLEAMVAILGCAYGGLVAGLLPPMFSAEQIRDVVDNTSARGIVGLGEPAELDRTQEVGGSTELDAIVVPDGTASKGSAQTWSSFMARGVADTGLREPMLADDPMLLTFSSGTTGVPKGVMHSTNTVRFTVESYARYQQIGSADTSLVVTAFGFIGSSVLGVYLSFLRGCRTVLKRDWNADEALELIERHRVTHFLLMPTHAIDLLASAKLGRTDCSSVSRGVLAGLSEAQRLEARQRLCARPFPMYGMSESPGHVTGSMADPWEKLRRTEGRWLLGTELLICDDEDHPLPAGTQGNIVVRGPNLFLGYFRADQLNAASLTDEGYFRTGDIGCVDADGYLTFVGRSKDIIRRGGVTITPGDVESALRPHPRIADIAVIGLPDPRLGERACACVITRDGKDMALAEITEFLQQKAFARYLWPEHVAVCTSFPRTPSLKVKKNELLKLVLELR